MTVRYAEVFLQLANDDGDILEWRATVAFTPKRGTHPLLGFAGFLQFFDTTPLRTVETSPPSLAHDLLEVAVIGVPQHPREIPARPKLIPRRSRPPNRRKRRLMR